MKAKSGDVSRGGLPVLIAAFTAIFLFLTLLTVCGETGQGNIGPQACAGKRGSRVAVDRMRKVMIGFSVKLENEGK